MKKSENLFIVIFIIVLNAFLFVINDLPILRIGIIILSIIFLILYFTIINKIKEKSLKKETNHSFDLGEEITDNSLKYTLMNIMNEVDKANIDSEILEQVYLNSLKLFETIITDKKTGLIIENHFKNILKNEIARSIRYHLNFGIIIIKIINYKEFKRLKIEKNELLRQIYHTTKSFLRDVDHIGKYGDEIIYLLPQTDFKGTVTVADKLLSVIRDIKFSEENIRLDIAIGLSEFPINGKNYDTLLNLAEKNVIKSEHIGGNQVIFNA